MQTQKHCISVAGCWCSISISEMESTGSTYPFEKQGTSQFLRCPCLFLQPILGLVISTHVVWSIRAKHPTFLGIERWAIWSRQYSQITWCKVTRNISIEKGPSVQTQLWKLIQFAWWLSHPSYESQVGSSFSRIKTWKTHMNDPAQSPTFGIDPHLCWLAESHLCLEHPILLKKSPFSERSIRFYPHVWWFNLV